MAVRAVIFDWGGTLTPWHTIDYVQLWQTICAEHYQGEQQVEAARAICAAERELWQAAERDHRSATIFQMLERAGIAPTQEFLASYTRAFEPHTFTDPQVPALLSYLHRHQIKVGVLSNTMWPRSWHDEVFRRDGVLDLIHGAVYSSEIDWTKPHPEAFRAAMAAVGVSDPAECVFVGDRPFDDVHGAKSVGMRAVLVPHSEVPAYEATMPDAVIARLADLEALIEAWNAAGG